MSATTLRNKVPTDADVARVLSGLAANYPMIGTFLGVKAGELASIQQGMMGNRVKLMQVIQEWKNAYVNVTWGKIMDVVNKDLENAATGAAIVKFLEDPDVYERYANSDDFAGPMQ